MSITATVVIDTARASHAAALYNDIFTVLSEHGWTEETEENHFWPKGKPTGWWRHPNHPGSFSMSAAFAAHAKERP